MVLVEEPGKDMRALPGLFHSPELAVDSNVSFADYPRAVRFWLVKVYGRMDAQPSRPGTLPWWPPGLPDYRGYRLRWRCLPTYLRSSTVSGPSSGGVTSAASSSSDGARYPARLLP
jgi:hypothetical protein